MGSLLGRAFFSAFMCHLENIWSENRPSQFKPAVYRRYVDDTFLVFCSTEHIEKLKKYLVSQHKNISFTSGAEVNGSL